MSNARLKVFVLVTCLSLAACASTNVSQGGDVTPAGLRRVGLLLSSDDQSDCGVTTVPQLGAGVTPDVVLRGMILNEGFREYQWAAICIQIIIHDDWKRAIYVYGERYELPAGAISPGGYLRPRLSRVGDGYYTFVRGSGPTRRVAHLQKEVGGEGWILRNLNSQGTLAASGVLREVGP